MTNLFFLVPLIGFIVFLYCLYGLTRDDHVFLRKNISSENVFDIALVAALAGIFFARLFYVIFNFSPSFLNPLVFLLFPYFPGLSLAGEVIGVTLFLFILSRKNKIPSLRLFDFFAISFLAALPFGLFVNMFLNSNKNANAFLEIILIILNVALFAYLLKTFQKGKIGEGSAALLSLVFFSVIYFLFNVIQNLKSFSLFGQKENFLLITVFFVSLLLFIKQEKIIAKLLKLRK